MGRVARSLLLGYGLLLTACSKSNDRPDDSRDIGTPLLSGVPMGSWSEYESRAAGLKFKLIVAVVGRSHGETVLETQSREAADARSHRVVIREIYGETSHAGDEPKARAVKIDAFPSMDFPSSAQPAAPDLSLKNVRPDNYVKAESIVVASGHFTARRHNFPLSSGGVARIWLDSGVAPLGLVKLETKSASGAPEEGAVIELTRQGVDARPPRAR